MNHVPIKTAQGTFTARFSESGLAHLDFPNGTALRSKAGKAGSQPQTIQRWAKLTQAALESVLEGKTPTALPPLDLATGTDFQRSVWKTLAGIPPGSTMTYTEVALAVERPKAVRAVGQACGANPIPLLVPCHRVLASHGGLGGFSGGLNWKRKLLAREGVQVEH